MLYKKTVFISLLTCVLTVAAAVLFAGASRQTVQVDGKEVGIEDGRKFVSTMLQSKDPKNEKMAIEILAKQLGKFVNEKQELDESLIDPLISFYNRQPGFDPNLKLTKDNIMEVTRSPKVFVFLVITGFGGKKGEKVLFDARHGSDPTMQLFAEKKEEFVAGITGREKIISESGKRVELKKDVLGELKTLPDRLPKMFGEMSNDDKLGLLKQLQAKKSEAFKAMGEKAALSIPAVLEKQFVSESNLVVKQGLITTIVSYKISGKDEAGARKFLKNLIDTSESFKLYPIKTHAQHVLEALDTGVFR